jgi:hypothetical protein
MAAVAERGGVSSEEAGDVLEIPPTPRRPVDPLERRWALPLRDAIARGGFRLASEFISPLDPVELGLV